MEERFGHDFSRVRVHSDGAAADSAQEVHAHAYTVGSHIVFGSGSYSPRAQGGRELLAHELAHVVQQGAAAPTAPRTAPFQATSGLVMQRKLKDIEDYQGTIRSLASLSPAEQKQIGWTEARACKDPNPPVESGALRQHCPVVLAPNTQVKVMQEAVGGAWLFVEHPPAATLGGQRYGYVPGAFVEAVMTAKPADSRNVAEAGGKASQPFSPERFEDQRGAVLKSLAEQLAKKRAEAQQQQMQANIGHMQVGRGVFGNIGGGGALQVSSQAMAEPAKDQLLAVAEVLESLEREIESSPLYAFVAGLVDGVRENLSPEVFANNAETFAKFAVYWSFQPSLQLSFLEGTASGVKKEIEGLVHLVTEFDEVWDQMKALAEAIASEGGPDVTRALGYQVGSETAKRLTEIGGITELDKLATALGETFGPLILQIALGIATGGGSAAASVSARMATLLANFPKLAAFLAKLKGLRKLVPSGKKKTPDAPHAKGGPHAPDAPNKPGAKSNSHHDTDQPSNTSRNDVGTPNGKKVIAEQSSEGHQYKVLEDGTIIRCSNCGKLMERVQGLEHAPAAQKKHLSAWKKELAEIDAITDPKLKAKRAAEFDKKFTTANGPGEWMDDFSVNNMGKHAESYQSRVTGAKPGKGYYVNKVQFDGFDAGVLIDAKAFTNDGRFVRDQWYQFNKAWSLLDDAKRQLKAADGAPIEWRVAGSTPATLIGQLFKTHGINISVKHVP